MKNKKKALLTAIAFTLGTTTPLVASTQGEKLFGLKELGKENILIAHGEGTCGEGKCAGGKCGGNCGEKVKGKEGNCGPDKKATKKVKVKKAKKKTTTKAKSPEANCGEGKCGGKMKGKEGQCGEGKCGGAKEKKQ